jgi:hypothetical protein
LYTQTDAFIRRSIHTHKHTFTLSNFYTKKRLHTGAFTYRSVANFF